MAHIVAGEHVVQESWPLGERRVPNDMPLAECDVEQEAQSANQLIELDPGDLLLDEVQLELADVLGLKSIGPTPYG